MKRTLVTLGLAFGLVIAAFGSLRGGSKDGGFTPLFNGKDFTGWRIFLDPKKKEADPKKIFTVQNGTIVCDGSVNGYLITDKDYDNYILKVEWRWGKPPAKGNRNSGVFVHVTGPDKIWPKAIEAQLMADHAGDFWLVDNFKLNVDPKRQDPKVARHYFRLKDGVEKPVGEWNQYEITCKGDTVKLVINGQLVNEGTGAELSKGKILLQSEGAEVHFRNVLVKSLGTAVTKAGDKKETDKKETDKKVVDKQLADKKTDDKKPADKKDLDKKVEDKKPVDKKDVDKKPDDKKPVDKKVDTKKPDDKKPLDKKVEDKKVEDKKPATPKAQTLNDYYAAADQAFKAGKPVVVWVGMRRPEVEKDLGDVIHVYLDQFPGVANFGIVVGVPNPTWLSRYDFPASATAQEISKVLKKKK